MFGHDRRELAAVFAGGALGTLARAAFGAAVVAGPGQWPWATFGVNIVGALLLGYLTVRLPASGYRRPLLGTGLCGGLTTFSTLQVEILRMIEHDAFALAGGYAAASVAAGLVAVTLGARWAAMNTGRASR